MRAAERAEGRRPARQRAQAADRLLGLLDRREDPLGGGQEQPPGLGELEPPAGPHEERRRPAPPPACGSGPRGSAGPCAAPRRPRRRTRGGPPRGRRRAAGGSSACHRQILHIPKSIKPGALALCVRYWLHDHPPRHCDPAGDHGRARAAATAPSRALASTSVTRSPSSTGRPPPRVRALQVRTRTPRLACGSAQRTRMPAASS